MFSRNSTRKPLNLTKSPIFTNTPCKSTCLCNAPSILVVCTLLILEMRFGNHFAGGGQGCRGRWRLAHEMEHLGHAAQNMPPTTIVVHQTPWLGSPPPGPPVVASLPPLSPRWPVMHFQQAVAPPRPLTTGLPDSATVERQKEDRIQRLSQNFP